MKKHLILTMIFILFLTACGNHSTTGNLKKVGLLVPETIQDPVWGNKGYKGLLRIQSSLKVDVYYKEGMEHIKDVRAAVEEFEDDGVNLIFGHGYEYGSIFKAIHQDFPDIHFVYFNGDFFAENVTSLKFDSHAMGFFGGVVAAEMSQTDNVGVIAAFDWQPEVQGFREGVQFHKSNVNVHIQYTHDWDEKEEALNAFESMRENKVDVFYPAGDGFNIPVIERVKEEDLYAIGFISDQLDLGQATVLTSTIQHVDGLYEVVASQFASGELTAGVRIYDFQDGVISLGEFSEEVPVEFQQKINEMVANYKSTGALPNNSTQ